VAKAKALFCTFEPHNNLDGWLDYDYPPILREVGYSRVQFDVFVESEVIGEPDK